MSWLRKLIGGEPLQASLGTHRPEILPNELTFKSGKEAIEYIAAFMKTNWSDGGIVLGLMGQPELGYRTLSGFVLIPYDGQFQQIFCLGEIRSVDGPEIEEFIVTPSTKLARLGIKEGDLVTVRLNGIAPPDMRKFTEWSGAIIGVNELTFSFELGGWKIKRRFAIKD
ncbi:hypothetical protein [Sediminicoccus sp. KRV36]|uniref:hypothetical protein n=1 Tax=Sediminicoccus sp. KRV36 TaxID=3133721 RepID=UPI00200CDAA9|nr:hypothetical protein [Sediminicoccus rosea]UPY38828.1 hypothetical protein LHU95_09065 [Sediminicoccus rosea]